MKRVFLDASVLFAAAYSSEGASREIIRRIVALGGLWQHIRFDISDEDVRALRRQVGDKVFSGSADSGRSAWSRSASVPPSKAT